MRHVLLPLALLIALSGCDRRDPNDTPAPATDAAAAAPAASTAPDNPATAPVADQPATATENDGVALALLAAVDEHEIAAAKQAQSRGVSAPVMTYAKMMEKDHTQNLEQTRALGPLADTEEVKAMKDKGQKDLDTLGRQTGQAYEEAYVEAMVKGHTEALSLIDTRLLTLASNGPVKDHLNATRQAVAHHLDEAKKLQSAR